VPQLMIIEIMSAYQDFSERKYLALNP
jgi:hypothetical protein